MTKVNTSEQASRQLGSHDLEMVEQRSCLNCSIVLVGDYCYECGQAANTERYRVSSLFKETYNAIRKIDLTTTAVTFSQLLTRPGRFVQEYLSGKRVGYSGPVKFFFYAFVVDLLVRSWINWFTGSGLLPDSPVQSAWIQVFDFVSTLFWGLLWRVFYSKSGLNLSECSVAALYFQGQANYLAIGVLLATVPIRLLSPETSNYLNGADIVITLVYAIVFAKDVFGESWRATLIKQLILTIFYVLLLFAVLILGALIILRFKTASGL